MTWMRPRGRWNVVKHSLLPGCENPSPKQKSAVLRVSARGLGRQARDPSETRPSDTAGAVEDIFSPFMAGVLLFARVPKADHIASIESKG